MRLRVPRTKAGQRAKTRKVLHEFKVGALHSGSKRGPLVRSRKQAIAIALNEAGLQKNKGRKHRRR